MPNNYGRTILNEAEEERWKARKEELGSEAEFAGMFRGWIPEGYFTEGQPRILYVGKATSGSFHEHEVERVAFNGDGKSAFWSFARQISSAVGCPESSLSCIAWSNISKISYPKIKAELRLIAGFEESAALTIEDEIATTDPNIIIFVTNHFSDLVVQIVAHGRDDMRWNKSENESTHTKEADIWWKLRPDGKAVLWMRHPMGASGKTLAFAAKKIASLIHG